MRALYFLFTVSILSTVLWFISPLEKRGNDHVVTESIHTCIHERAFEEKIDCALSFMESSIQENNLPQAITQLTWTQNTLLTQQNQNVCHRIAHSMGDILYYEHRIDGVSIFDYTFPEGSDVCLYGIYHGYFEHLIQSVPDAASVTEICEHMKVTHTETVPGIGHVCYHAAGHGLALDAAENAQPSEYGDIHAFIDTPLQICSELQHATPDEVDECYGGIFTILYGWKWQNEYGFSDDFKNVLDICKLLEQKYQKGCYAETILPVLSTLDFSVLKLFNVISQIKNQDVQTNTFKNGIFGIAQHRNYEEIITQCSTLGTEFQELCIEKIIAYTFSFGSTDTKVEHAASICNSEIVSEMQLTESCHQHVNQKL